MERRNAGGDEIGGRPAAPRADLDPAPSFERARVAIEDRSFVAIDEADRRIASVDAKRMVDLFAKIGPSRGALVRLDHVRKEMIENRRFEIGGDIVLGHGSDLEQRNEIAAPAFDQICFWRASGAARRGLRRMARCAVRRQERPRTRRRNAATIGHLYLTCSRITCCLTRKSEVYDVHGSAASSGRARGATLKGRRRTARSKARSPCEQSGMLAACDLQRIGRMSRTERTRQNDGFAS